MDAPPITLRQIDADALPQLQALYESSRDYFMRHSGAAARPDQAALDYQNVLAGGERVLLGIYWQREQMVGCFDLRLDHPEPGVIWFGALILADAPPAPRHELREWSLRILEEWLRLTQLGHEMRLALLVSDRENVRFWSGQGFAATGQALRQPIGTKQERLIIYHKAIAASP
ncbi:MAG: hypothetical protein K1X65_17300 [Caldilineales bacterium]|nr:hypothetical protein [Caldilineales bacterium]MCW5858222.1 hypothetical protein [Caldilineales bacterium]